MLSGRGLSVMALICALPALCVSGVALRLAWTAPTADEVYNRILEEAWSEVEPVLTQFGLEATEPASFGELLQPFIGVDNAVLQHDDRAKADGS